MFKSFTSLDADGPLTVAALTQGSIQAADMFTTDSTIQKNDWVVLEDPKFGNKKRSIMDFQGKIDEAQRALDRVKTQADAKKVTSDVDRKSKNSVWDCGTSRINLQPRRRGSFP